MFKITATINTTNVAAHAQSFAIFTSTLYSFVIKSHTLSIAVFISSIDNINPNIHNISIHSLPSILNIKPNITSIKKHTTYIIILFPSLFLGLFLFFYYFYIDSLLMPYSSKILSCSSNIIFSSSFDI